MCHLWVDQCALLVVTLLICFDVQVIAEKKKDEVSEAAKEEIPPFDREIFVITMIKKKVKKFCASSK